MSFRNLLIGSAFSFAAFSSNAFAGCHLVFQGIHSHFECDEDTPSVITDPVSQSVPGQQLRNANSNLCVDIAGGSSANGAKMLQWPCNGNVGQRFLLEGDPVSGSQFTDKKSGKCIDVPQASRERGVQLIQWQCHGDPNQRWRFESAGNGWYRIVNKNSGMCLDVPGASTQNGAILIQWPCTGNRNQLWRLQ